MSEQTVNIADILDGETLAPSQAHPNLAPKDEEGEDQAPKKPDDHVPFNLDKGAADVNDALKRSLERALAYPELPVVMIDLLNPGLAVTRLQADWLVKLEPWQHALVAFGLIFAVAYATNPDLKDRLRRGAQAKKEMKRVGEPRKPPTPKATGDPI